MPASRYRGGGTARPIDHAAGETPTAPAMERGVSPAWRRPAIRARMFGVVLAFLRMFTGGLLSPWCFATPQTSDSPREHPIEKRQLAISYSSHQLLMSVMSTQFLPSFPPPQPAGSIVCASNDAGGMSEVSKLNCVVCVRMRSPLGGMATPPTGKLGPAGTTAPPPYHGFMNNTEATPGGPRGTIKLDLDAVDLEIIGRR